MTIKMYKNKTLYKMYKKKILAKENTKESKRFKNFESLLGDCCHAAKSLFLILVKFY